MMKFPLLSVQVILHHQIKKEIHSLNIHAHDDGWEGDCVFFLFITITFFAELRVYAELLSRQSTPSEAH
jgi:hypothetical protein